MRSFTASIALLLVVVGYCAAQTCSFSKDYCSLCANHVCCNTTKTPSLCSNHTNVKFMAYNITSQTLICNLTNAKRQLVANGQTKFPPCARMATVGWNPETADLAGKNVQQCDMKHDVCRCVPGNCAVGQNIFFAATTGPHYSIWETIIMAIDAWFNEIVDCTPADMENLTYGNGTHFAKIGHFTQTAQEKCTSIGCSGVQATGSINGYTGKFNKTIITCNYGSGNILNQPVCTKSNVPASGCKTGKNPNYSALCSTAEKY